MKSKLYILVRKDSVQSLSPIWPVLLPKIAQNDFPVFLWFSHFWRFWPTKWPPNSNLTWSVQHNLGVPDLFVLYDFFVRALFMPQNFILNIFLDLFVLLITFLSDFSYFSRFSSFLHSYTCRRSSNRVCSCFFFLAFLYCGCGETGVRAP